MDKNKVKFGTSGIRGLVSDMTDKLCYAYTLSFLAYLQETKAIKAGSKVAVAGDLRRSTPQIMNAVAAAVLDAGYEIVNAGLVPTPALTLYGIAENMPTLMVTGSHIPDDRNGIKFNKPTGEVLKDDEQGILAQNPTITDSLFDQNETLLKADYLPEINPEIEQRYIQRYLDFFPAQLLAGKKIGIYQHSSVARDLLPKIFTSLGADVICLGWSEAFISVDTEAIRPEDVVLAKQWSDEYAFDCIISTDGDADRPLVSDENGEWLRGDVAGILVAQFLQADAVITPVSSNSALEKSNSFTTVMRTKIGSPYVIAAMQSLTDLKTVVGYEANGGFLLNTAVTLGSKTLAALPTRDAVLIPLCILSLAKNKNCTISDLLKTLPARYTYSDRIKNFPTELSASILETLKTGDKQKDAAKIKSLFADEIAEAVAINTLDGVRITLSNDEVVHLRGSGNAPELRCYTEAASYERAKELNQLCIKQMVSWKISE
ncbi:MAG: phosphomannomutase [Methyloprofundus sp.]|nr:phosphomannomutase [Methyloprofundus sp.]